MATAVFILCRPGAGGRPEKASDNCTRLIRDRALYSFTYVHGVETPINIFNLKNAGICLSRLSGILAHDVPLPLRPKQLYVRNLPLSKEMAKNFQSFGGR